MSQSRALDRLASSSSSSTSLFPPFLRRRKVLLVCFALFLVFLTFVWQPLENGTRRGASFRGGKGWSGSHHSDVEEPQQEEVEEEKPPSYEKLREWEDNLPQHNLDLPYPEGRAGRYVKFSNQIKHLGWNNVFNEILMNTHLAYESKRAYVFIDYYWKGEYYHWPKSLSYQLPRTPLNAIISGPTAGGPWDPEDPAPRSVTDTYWEKACPESERRLIYTKDVKPAVADARGQVVFDHWKDLLLNAPERCVEIIPNPEVDGFPQTFDLWFWGSGRVVDMWERFINSPTSRLLSASPLVNSGLTRNEYLFFPRGPRPAHPSSRDPYDRMLAVHVRRGDFSEACISLAQWKSTYYSWNLLPQLPDKFNVPEIGEGGVRDPQREAIYMEHCLPDTAAIVKKIHDSRAEYVNHIVKASGGVVQPTLDVIYLLTNEHGEQLEMLKTTLRRDGWYTIVTSGDLELDKEQRDVDMAIDMEIARKAAVFIGNGWSSFTSNIVHQRLTNGKSPMSCRFY